jgi:dihydroxy-acid dehydratase
MTCYGAHAGSGSLSVSDDEVAGRRIQWQLADMLKKYVQLVGPAHLGAVTYSGNVKWPQE